LLLLFDDSPVPACRNLLC